MKKVYQRLIFLGCACFLTSCAYQLGGVKRGVPGGFHEVSIPILKNKTMEPGVEVLMTNAMRLEFQRSLVAKVVDEDKAPVRLEGSIENIRFDPFGPQNAVPGTNDLPTGTVLATVYNAVMNVKFSLVRKSDGQVIWASGFHGEKIYNAPQVTVAGVNSVNANYNVSARRMVLQAISTDISAEAYDRITENF